MGQALYRKYRSKSLDEIVGQSHVTDILRRALANGNVAHAYLLTGPRGVGKTSIARILAHEINGLPYTDESTHLDIIEIDAASNNSVEDIRDLRDKVQIAPSTAQKKIYIIDEVHMLSKSAFNALLKTLEEPPAHVVFILATTDADKLPATIISRVQRFNFRAIGRSDLRQHLRVIADAEKIDISDEALELISLHGNGSFRDSIGLLDQLRNAASGQVTPADIEAVLGLAESDVIQQLLDAYRAGDIATVVSLLDTVEARGTPPVLVANQLAAALRQIITQEPQLLPLLDALADVPRSAWPHIKLLTALASQTPGQTSVPTPPAATRQPVTPAPKAPTPAAPKPKTQSQPTVVSTPAPAVEAVHITNPQPFDWQRFLEQVRPQSPGAAGLLAKSSYEFDGTTLVIYAGKKFQKAQLDKSLPLLATALEAVGTPDGHIKVLAASKPPEDSTAAAVLDIMGGGEEVKL